MEDSEIPKTAYQPWHPITDPQDLKTLGKFGEELGECQAAAMRCLIQGLDGKEPRTGKVNRHWLEDEIADVLTNMDLVVERFNLDADRIRRRKEAKAPLLQAWHSGA